MNAWERIDGRGRTRPGTPSAGPGAGADPPGEAGGPAAAGRQPPDWPFTPPGGVRDRRRLRTVAGVLLLIAAVGLLALGVLRVRDRPPAAATPQLARFALPAGWTDRTAALAPRVRGVRPAFVFQGPVHGGFASNLNVVRERRGPQDPPLDQLVELVAASVATELGASPAGPRRRLVVDGAPAIAYDYRYRAGGRRLRARQVTLVHGEGVVFLNFTAAEGAFTRDVRALDQMVASWRWH
ncbi:MAG TPA: DcrB-related protein [Actinomycetes bacterium]|nr:DcrB-related protein [Actinomycetes bacterium]